jgi:hypothetical protein
VQSGLTTFERGPGNGPICVKSRMMFDSQGMHGWGLWDGEGGEKGGSFDMAIQCSA